MLSELDDSWSFKDIARTETSYLTHSYHRYPAKFIPQVAGRLIRENSRKGDLVCDPFMGSGTTLLEAIVNDRHAYGADINPVAVLIARAKTTPIEPSRIRSKVIPLLKSLDASAGKVVATPNCFGSTRIDYWFPERQKQDLALILSRIKSVDDDVQTFLLCSFSNILKGCSRWLMKSVKPTRDKNKVIADANRSFILQTKRMMIKNEELWNALQRKKFKCVTDNKDARQLSVLDSACSLVVSSPPYVTSYEYADLHQLTALWLGYFAEGAFREFRSRFIGSIQREKPDHKIKTSLYSTLAKETIASLRASDPRAADAAERYFFEMQQCFEEMNRILKPKGRAAIVIGDTDLRKIKIRNAEIFVETMNRVGFKTHNIIERPIPSKILPVTRDEKTGRFASTAKADRLAYPTEFIIVMEA